MLFLTRRSVIAGASVSAATCLAGCTNPNPSLNAAAIADAVEPQYSSIYAEIKDGAFTVPAVNLAQINPALLRTNIARRPRQRVDDPSHSHDVLEGRKRPQAPSARRRDCGGRRRSTLRHSSSRHITGWSKAARHTWRVGGPRNDRPRHNRAVLPVSLAL
jgi:hypothetical protein